MSFTLFLLTKLCLRSNFLNTYPSNFIFGVYIVPREKACRVLSWAMLLVNCALNELINEFEPQNRVLAVTSSILTAADSYSVCT